MDNLLNQKPCAVQTSQGFSVSYKNHFLYSKYNPAKTILQTVSSLNILPGTIILCNSPVLSYGISELQTALPKDSVLIFCEADSELYNFTLENNPLIKNVLYFTGEQLKELPVTVYKMAEEKQYKRVMRVDFSAGVQFYSSFYEQIFQSCTESVSTFWKNRITLTKFGRRYSHNLFWNLKRLPDSTPIKCFEHSVNKPIIVFGAGQSLDSFFINNSINASDYFIIAVDTALQPLMKHNIIPNGVFIEEAQSVISKAFIGAHKSVHYFAGLSSVPFLYKNISSEKLSYFATEYSGGNFFYRFKALNSFPTVNPPFGSVGLTAVFYALKFRKSDSIPVYITGLDFSYSAGMTHANNTLAHTTRLLQQSRIKQAANYGAAYNTTASKTLDKNKNNVFTTPSLLSYAKLFNQLFACTPNLFDCGNSGLPLAAVRAKPIVLNNSPKEDITLSKYTEMQQKEIKDFLNHEKSELLYLRDLLTGKIIKEAEELQKEVSSIIQSKEYLYLHFADGFKYSYTQSFLNRVRTEIDFFLKIFD